MKKLVLLMALDKSNLMQCECDEEMFPKYIIGEAMSFGAKAVKENSARKVTI